MDDQSKRTPENKSNSTVWFALIVVAAVAVSLFLILSQNQKTLKYAGFQELLRTTKYADKFGNKLVPGTEDEARLKIQEPGTEDRVVEYSEPNDLIVGSGDCLLSCFYRN